MRQYELTKKEREKIFQLVGEDPTYSDISQLFLYRDKWRKLDFFVFTLNNTPPSDPAYPLVIGLEELLSKPLSRTDWVELRDEIIQTRFEPAPRTPLFRFNDIATHLPFLMRFEGRRITGNIEIQATTLPLPIFEILLKDNPELQKKLISDPERSRFITKSQKILFLLWECYSQNIDLGRLKKCSVCGKWFVDRTKNKTKARCSTHCTNLYWSWNRRKTSNHDLTSQHNRKREHPQSKKKGSRRKP
jgi:hypothetical protein